MKKFLTMLLALSVVFTYTVGTAFAAEPAADKYDKALKDLETAKNVTVAGLADDDAFDISAATGKIKVTKAVFEAVANEIYNDYLTVIRIAKDKGLGVEEAITGVNAQFNGKTIGDADTAAEFKALITSDYKYSVAKLALEDVRKDALAKAEKIDLTLYAEEVVDADAAYPKTHLELATAAKAAIVKTINDAVIKDTKTIPAVAGLVDTIKNAVADRAVLVAASESVNDIYGNPSPTSYKFSPAYIANPANKLVGLQTKDEIKDATASLESKKLAAKAQISAKAVSYVSNAAKDDKAAAQATADAYVEVETYLVDTYHADRKAAVDNIGTTPYPYGPAKALENRVEAYGKYADKVAELKLVTNLDGTKMYDAAKLDELLEAQKGIVYAGTAYDSNFATLDADLDAFVVKANSQAKNVADNYAENLKVAVAKVEAKKAEVLEADKYYELEKAAVVAIYDKVIAEYNATVNQKQLDVVNAKYAVDLTDVAAVATAAGEKTPLIKSSVESAFDGKTAYTNAKASLDLYVKNVLNGTNVKYDDMRVINLDKALKEFYGEKGARTDAEIAALYDEAKAMLGTLPTNGEKRAAKDEAEALVKALPARPTLENKDQVVAAFEAAKVAKELGAPINTDYQTKLDAVISNTYKVGVKDLEVKAIDKMVKELKTTDKAAVKAVIAAMEAYQATEMYNDDAKYATEIKNYEKALRTADRLAVENAINALSNNSSKAEVEAARAAYDAYVAEYTDYATADLAANDFTKLTVEKLLLVEAQVKAKDIAAVESVKVKASSKAYKGAIRVNWTVKGDKDAVDGYEVFRSVKKNSGFGTKAYFKTTKTTYKNTKALKKGTRYYYKVRAYKVVDGKKYYSDWSNKAYRIAK